MVFEAQYTSSLYASRYADHFFWMVNRNRDRIAEHFPKTNAKTGSIGDTRVYSEEIESRQKEKSYFMYLILKRDKDQPIGFIDIKNIDWQKRRAEMGAFVDIHFESLGIMTHFSNKLLDRIALEHSFNTLFCRIVPHNVRSIRLVERNGFLFKPRPKDEEADIEVPFNLYEKHFKV